MSTETPAPTAVRPSGLASSAVLSTVGFGVQGLSKLAVTVVIGRVFGTETLGQATALLSLSVFVALLWPTPAGNTASRYLAIALRRGRDDAALNRLLGRTLLGSVLLLAVLTVPIALAWGNGIGTALGGAWLVAGFGAYCYTRGAQLGYARAPRVALWDGITSVVALVALVLACVGRLEAVVLMPLALGYTVFAVVCWPRGNRVTGTAESTVGVLRFASWNVLAGVTTNGLLQLTMISATVTAGAHDAGVYAAAFTLATPASMLGQAVSQVVIPAFAHRADASSLRSRGAVLLVGGFAGATAVVFGLVALLAGWFLPLFYPAEGALAVGDLRFLVLGVWVFTVSLLPAALLLAAGRSRQVALASLVGFVVGVVLMAVLGPVIGVTGGSIGFLAGSAVTLVAVVALGLRR